MSIFQVFIHKLMGNSKIQSFGIFKVFLKYFLWHSFSSIFQEISETKNTNKFISIPINYLHKKSSKIPQKSTIINWKSFFLFFEYFLSILLVFLNTIVHTHCTLHRHFQSTSCTFFWPVSFSLSVSLRDDKLFDEAVHL